MSHASEDTLVAFVGGALPPSAASALERHLADCLECQRVLGATARAMLRSGSPHAATLSSAQGEGGPEAPLPRGAQVDRYLVVGLVGRGGMGEVYEAHDPQLARTVALKRVRASAVDPELPGRLLREARAMARLAHPCVAKVYDVRVHHGRVFIALEFVPGTTLKAWLLRKHPWRAVVEKLLQAGEGLAAAHAAGIIHRDFKPENVLLHEDGRVLVSDFGLAGFGQEAKAPEAPASATPHAAPLTHTATGALLGTPAYMSPEQHRGREADARSDQFGFCATLYEALTAQRPYDAQTLEALAHQKEQGPREPPAHPAPAWLWRVVRRGLRAAPDERYPSMDALLKDLRRGLTRGRRAALLGAALAAVLLVASGAAVTARKLTLEVCPSEHPEALALWAPQVRDKVERAFAATGKPYAAAAFATVDRTLQGYGQRFGAARKAACEATRRTGEQSEELLDRRMACLDQKLREAQALVELFTAADAGKVERAASAVETVTGLAPCADLASLAAGAPLPTDEPTRARARVLQEGLARAKAQHVAGAWARAAEQLDALAKEAAALPQLPVRAEALYLSGQAQRYLKQPKAALPVLEEGVLAAEASGTGAFQVLSWLERADAFLDLTQLPEAEVCVRHALALLQRVPAEGDLAFHQLATRGHLAMTAGKGEEALGLAKDALALEQGRHGAQSRQVAAAQHNVAAALSRVGRYEESAVVYGQVREGFVRNLGPEHPVLVSLLNNMAQLEQRRGNGERALQLAEEALQRAEALFGRDHPVTLRSLNQQLIAMMLLERPPAQIEPLLLRLISAEEVLKGAHHPDVELHRVNLSHVRARAGDLEGALRLAREACASLEGPVSMEMGRATCELQLGTLLLEARRPKEALPWLRSGQARREKVFGPSHRELASGLTVLAQALVEVGELPQAQATLDRVTALLAGAPPDPRDQAEAAFTLARLRWAQNGRGDRGRALELAREALADWRKLGLPEHAAQVEAWLTPRSATPAAAASR